MTTVPEPMNVIYGLHAGDGVVRYVGKTTQGCTRRLAGHRADSRGKSIRHVLNWMRTSGADSIVAVTLETCETPAELSEREIYWIAKLRSEGAALTNHTDGGEGILGNVRSAETRAKIAAGNRGKKRSPEAIAAAIAGRRGKPMTDKTRRILSAAAIKRYEGKPSHLLGTKLSPELLASNRDRMLKQLATREVEGLLNARKVLEMRELWANGESNTSIAKRFGVGRATARNAIMGKSWSAVTV